MNEWGNRLQAAGSPCCVVAATHVPFRALTAACLPLHSPCRPGASPATEVHRPVASRASGDAASYATAAWRQLNGLVKVYSFGYTIIFLAPISTTHESEAGCGAPDQRGVPTEASRAEVNTPPRRPPQGNFLFYWQAPSMPSTTRAGRAAAAAPLGASGDAAPVAVLLLPAVGLACWAVAQRVRTSTLTRRSRTAVLALLRLAVVVAACGWPPSKAPRGACGALRFLNAEVRGWGHWNGASQCILWLQMQL